MVADSGNIFADKLAMTTGADPNSVRKKYVSRYDHPIRKVTLIKINGLSALNKLPDATSNMIIIGVKKMARPA